MADELENLVELSLEIIHKQLEFEEGDPALKNFLILCWERGKDYVEDDQRFRRFLRYEQVFFFEKSDYVRRTIPCQTKIPYGNSDKQCFDLFGYHTLPEDSPVLIMVHGGGWITGSRDQHSFLANSFFKESIVTAVVGYDLLPFVTLDESVQQIRRCVESIRDFTKNRPIFVCGASAGAQLVLAAVLLGKESPVVEGLISIASVYTLVPFVNSFTFDIGNIDKETALGNSLTSLEPDILADRVRERCPSGILAVVGQWDCPGVRSHLHLAENLFLEAEIPFRTKVISKKDHLDVFFDLFYEDYSLTQDIVFFVKTGILPQ